MLRTAGNGVQGNTLGAKREEVKGGCRKRHDDKIENFLFTPEIMRTKNNETSKSYGKYGGQKKCSKNLFGKHEGNRSLEIT